MEDQAPKGRVYKGAEIAWGGGRFFDLANPNPETITREDIAYALAFTVRWRGQARFKGKRCFWGVADHCIYGARQIEHAGLGKEAALAFLLHELDEVPLPDMPAPAKGLIAGYREVAGRVRMAMDDHFQVPMCYYTLVKETDWRMYATEKRDLFPGHEHDQIQSSDGVTIDEEKYPAFKHPIVPYSHPREAAEHFLREWSYLEKS